MEHIDFIRAHAQNESGASLPYFDSISSTTVKLQRRLEKDSRRITNVTCDIDAVKQPRSPMASSFTSKGSAKSGVLMSSGAVQTPLGATLLAMEAAGNYFDWLDDTHRALRPSVTVASMERALRSEELDMSITVPFVRMSTASDEAVFATLFDVDQKSRQPLPVAELYLYDRMRAYLGNTNTLAMYARRAGLPSMYARAVTGKSAETVRRIEGGLAEAELYIAQCARPEYGLVLRYVVDEQGRLRDRLDDVVDKYDTEPTQQGKFQRVLDAMPAHVLLPFLKHKPHAAIETYVFERLRAMCGNDMTLAYYALFNKKVVFSPMTTTVQLLGAVADAAKQLEKDNIIDNRVKRTLLSKDFGKMMFTLSADGKTWYQRFGTNVQREVPSLFLFRPDRIGNFVFVDEPTRTIKEEYQQYLTSTEMAQLSSAPEDISPEIEEAYNTLVAIRERLRLAGADVSRWGIDPAEHHVEVNNDE